MGLRSNVAADLGCQGVKHGERPRRTIVQAERQDLGRTALATVFIVTSEFITHFHIH